MRIALGIIRRFIDGISVDFERAGCRASALSNWWGGLPPPSMPSTSLSDEDRLPVPQRLLGAHAAPGGDPIKRSEVHLYQLCLAARWYRVALQGRGSEPPGQVLAKPKGILRRAGESTR
jgi:hypothetical protein